MWSEISGINPGSSRVGLVFIYLYNVSLHSKFGRVETWPLKPIALHQQKQSLHCIIFL